MSITFEIEKLERAKELIPAKTYNEVLDNIVISHHNYGIKGTMTSKDYPINIVAKNKITGELTDYGHHAFFNSMHQAYAEHRPFIISPDMIWLLITQGFAKHIAGNAELLKKSFINFDKRLSLTVENTKINIDNPESPWEEIFPGLIKKTGDLTGSDLIETLISDFSTTTLTEKIATGISIFKAKELFFEYIQTRLMICGIPELTLEGTVNDWKNVLDKANSLRKYKLDWWINELEPILNEFIKTSEKNVDTDFWINMFKYHTEFDYGGPKTIDGWITNFFPYNKYGKKNEIPILRFDYQDDILPEEILKLDFNIVKNLPNGLTETVQLELWSGFMGAEQDEESMALRPKIGWMIRKKDAVSETAFKQKDGNEIYKESGIPVSIEVYEIPDEILSYKEIGRLLVWFIEKINIPKELAEIDIDDLSLYGEIKIHEIFRILKLFPKTKVDIYDAGYPRLIINIVILRFLLGKTRQFFRFRRL